MEWISAKVKPEENGIYICVVEHYKDPYEIKLVGFGYFGEWKMSKKWNLLMWKKRGLD